MYAKKITNLEFLLTLITRETGAHRIITFENNEQRQQIMNFVIQKYGIASEENPSAIYIKDYDIAKDKVFPNDEETVNRKNILLREYYKHYIVYEIIKAHESLISGEAEKEILDCFRFKQEILSIADLKKKLQKAMSVLKDVFDKYYETCSVRDFWDEIEVEFLSVDNVCRTLQEQLAVGLCNLFFDGDNINIDVNRVLNGYISSRIGGVVSFNILLNDYKAYYYTDLFGNWIQPIHDYKSIAINQYVKY